MGKEQIKIELMDSMGTDLSTVNSARVSFDKESEFELEIAEEGFVGNATMEQDGLYKFILKEPDEKLINYLASHKHMTPFRHNQIQIRCHAPIFLARQLGKHQSGLSWNEVSRRYVDDEPEFFIPDEWRGRPDGSIKQGSEGVVDTSEVWTTGYGGPQALDSMLKEVSEYQLCLYNEMLTRGVAPELARIILPQSHITSWWWTGNLLAFAHVYKERSNEGAQLEAQWFAEELDKVIRPLFPVSWSALVDK